MFYAILYKSADSVGIIGVVLMLIAYYLLSTNKMAHNSLTYQVLNLIGAMLVLYSLYFHWNLASALVESAWIIISSIGIYGIKTSKKKKTSNLYVIKKDADAAP